jgi:hypothetical protein
MINAPVVFVLPCLESILEVAFLCYICDLTSDLEWILQDAVFFRMPRIDKCAPPHQFPECAVYSAAFVLLWSVERYPVYVSSSLCTPNPNLNKHQTLFTLGLPRWLLACQGSAEVGIGWLGVFPCDVVGAAARVQEACAASGGCIFM